jgi:hypothetical protein
MFVECTGGKVIPREELLGFVSVSETTDENLVGTMFRMMYVFRCWNPLPNPGLNTSMNT